jgi:PAT family beta-lactamase induction signal transducer AmpG
LFYRFGEAVIGKLVPVFLQDKYTGPGDITRGLGFDVETFGYVNGVYGVVGILLGGIIGGMFISRVGIRKSFWPLAAAMNIPNIMYIWAASALPGAGPMSIVMFVDQFGYGFGFAGYLVALMYIAQQNPNFRTAHYAIGTGLGATFIMLAGILSAALVDNLDYGPIFWIVLAFTFPCLLTILLLPKEILDSKGAEVSLADLE